MGALLPMLAFASLACAQRFGGAWSQASSWGSQAAPTPVPAATKARRTGSLKDRLKDAIDFRGGSPAGDAAFDKALDRLLKTRLGSELAEELVAEGRRGTVLFGPIPGTEVIVENGRRILRLTNGQTGIFAGEIQVKLSENFLRADERFRADYLPGVIAHELLGHGLEEVRAADARVGQAYGAYRGDEANAALVGWTVDAELGAPLENPYLWEYLQDPEKYHATLQGLQPYYAGLFSLEEMRDLPGAYARRLQTVSDERVKFQAEIDDYKSECPTIEHFVKIHHMPRYRFRSLIEQIDGFFEVWVPHRLKQFDAIENRLRSTRDGLGSSYGKYSARVLAEQSANPYFAGLETRLERRREALAALVHGRGQGAATTRASDQASWEDLHALKAEDEARHPEHWK